MPQVLTTSDLNTQMQRIIDDFTKKAAAQGVAFNTDFLAEVTKIIPKDARSAAALAANLSLYDNALSAQNTQLESALGRLTVDAMNQLAAVQKKFYHSTIPSLSDEEIDAFIGDTKRLALQIATISYKNIADAGWSDALDAFKKTIIAGGSKDEAIDALKNVLVPFGISPLPQNIGSATTDALNQFARVYNMTVMASMGQEWFSYTGSLMETSRCFCIALEERGFFHISEIPLLLQGKYSTGPMKCETEDGTHSVRIYERTGLPEGMIPGTTQQSFFVYAGGWNCGHQIFPVSEALVPTPIKEEVRNSPGYKNYLQNKTTFVPPLVEARAVDKKPNLRPNVPTIFAGENIHTAWAKGTLKNKGFDTEQKFKDADGKWTPERKILHESIFEKFMQGIAPLEQKRLMLVGGAPAAGKSTLIKTNKGLKNLVRDGYANVEVDAFKRALPEYEAMVADGNSDAARYVHEEGSYMTKEFTKRLSKQEVSMVMDKVWNDGWQNVNKTVRPLADKGYTTAAKYILKDKEKLLAQAEARFKRSGFKVNEAYISHTADGVKRDVAYLIAKKIIDEIEVFDGNEFPAEGQEYPLIMSFKNGKLKVGDQDAYEQWMRDTGIDFESDEMFKIFTDKLR